MVVVTIPNEVFTFIAFMFAFVNTILGGCIAGIAIKEYIFGEIDCELFLVLFYIFASYCIMGMLLFVSVF